MRCDGVVQPLTIYHEKIPVEFFPEKKEGTGCSESEYHIILTITPTSLHSFAITYKFLVPKDLPKMKQNWLKTEK